jgi:hypothetical protein
MLVQAIVGAVAVTPLNIIFNAVLLQVLLVARCAPGTTCTSVETLTYLVNNPAQANIMITTAPVHTNNTRTWKGNTTPHGVALHSRSAAVEQTVS